MSFSSSISDFWPNLDIKIEDLRKILKEKKIGIEERKEIAEGIYNGLSYLRKIGIRHFDWGGRRFRDTGISARVKFPRVAEIPVSRKRRPPRSTDFFRGHSTASLQIKFGNNESQLNSESENTV